MCAAADDFIMARLIGVRAHRVIALAFMQSGALAAVVSVLYVAQTGTLPPRLGISLVLIAFVATVIGGMNSLAGAVVGTIVVSTIGELLRRIESGFEIGTTHVGAPPGLKEVGLALLMLVILIFRPQGITRGREVPWPWRRPEGS